VPHQSCNNNKALAVAWRSYHVFWGINLPTSTSPQAAKPTQHQRKKCPAEQNSSQSWTYAQCNNYIRNSDNACKAFSLL